ncbi:MAG: 3,4-dehydroadipyl-CoA semialdehyde dehydrogenase [Planctomycetes bacterium]|nr:3,4-dehydroadipyl-CoA semialdehyde dehydrogenase [Planctomycetota bacterium]
MRNLENHVLGSWRAPSGRLADLTDPTTGAVIARCGTEGIDMKAVAAYGRDVGGPALRAMTFAQRGAMLEACWKAVHAIREELIELAVRNSGNTRKDAKFDIDGAIATLSAYAVWGNELGDTQVMLDGEGLQLGRTPRFWGQHVLVPREGVAVHVNAFNFPAWGLAEKAACALLAGVPCIEKPATATAVVAERLLRACTDAGALPPGAVQLLCGSVGDLLDHLGPQDCLAFTGSADTALKLRGKENLLRWSVRVNVEADSLNAAVLGPDVAPGSETWNLFVRDVATDVTQKAGQKCTAIRRILVPADRVADAEAALVERISSVVIGDPSNDEVRMGPLATAAQRDDIRAGIAKLATECDFVMGAAGEPDALVGCEKGKGCFQRPVLFRAKDTAAAKLVHEHEVFGPCATILPYDGSAASAGAIVAKGKGGLVASVFSDDREFVRAMVVAIAPWNGRLYLGSGKMADQSLGPGTVLPGSVHGGPGRAGGGEELGKFRGLSLYQQRTALQGDRAVIEKLFAR